MEWGQSSLFSVSTTHFPLFNHNKIQVCVAWVNRQKSYGPILKLPQDPSNLAANLSEEGPRQRENMLMYTNRTRNRGYFTPFLLLLLQSKHNTRRYAQYNLSCEDLQTGSPFFFYCLQKQTPLKEALCQKHLFKNNYRNIHPLFLAEGVMKTKPGVWIINSFKTRLNKLQNWSQLHSVSKEKLLEVYEWLLIHTET